MRIQNKIKYAYLVIVDNCDTTAGFLFGLLGRSHEKGPPGATKDPPRPHQEPQRTTKGPTRPAEGPEKHTFQLTHKGSTEKGTQNDPQSPPGAAKGPPEPRKGLPRASPEPPRPHQEPRFS